MADRKFPIVDVILGAAVSLAVLIGFIVSVGPLDALELKLYGLRAKMRATHQVGDEIVIVAVDDASISQIGPWPWPRSYMGQLLDQVSESEAKVIALDILYSDAQINPGLESVRSLHKQLQDAQAHMTFEKDADKERAQSRRFFGQFFKVFDDTEKRLDNDARLVDSFALAGNTVLAMNFGLPGPPLGRPDQPPSADILKNALPGAESGLKGSDLDAKNIVPPIDRFAKEGRAIGHINWQPERDGAIRRQPLVVEYDGKEYPFFSLRVARVYLNLDPGEILPKADGAQVGTCLVPTDSRYQMLVNFNWDVKTFPHFSFVDVVTNKVTKENFKGKIVLVGSTATGLGEQRAMSVSATLPAVEYFANVVENILHNKLITRPPWARNLEIGVMVLFALFVAIGLPLLPAGISAAIAAALLAVFGGTAFWLFISKGYWIQMMYPSLLLVVGYVVVVSKRYFGTERAKETLETESVETLKMLGLSFQGQGMLDMAWGKFRRVPVDAGMKDTLYSLALDFERKRRFNKSIAVLEHIATVDRNFKDIPDRMQKLKVMGETQISGTAGLKKRKAESTILLTQTDVKTTLGRYEVIRELGKGAMGTVYLGRDPKINRQLAIKTLRFDDKDLSPEDRKALQERFFREAESAGRLTHPNIVNIYDAGEDQDINYIAMELLDGADLKPWCAKGRLHPVREALDYAHGNNIVHRDIKPANLMILKNGAIKITDFGIARITDQPKTVTGTVLGTPSYMSPEPLAGKKVDGRSDIFSLGGCLYELLSGEKPFADDSVATLIYQITNEPHRPPREINPAVPEAVQAVINRALEKDPAWRYQKAGEMAADLRKALAALEPAHG